MQVPPPGRINKKERISNNIWRKSDSTPRQSIIDQYQCAWQFTSDHSVSPESLPLSLSDFSMTYQRPNLSRYPKVMVIHDDYSMESLEVTKKMKRRQWEVTNSMSLVMDEIISNRPPFIVGDEDLTNRRPNKHIALVVWVTMAIHGVQEILVDQGSSVNVMFLGLLTRLVISPEDLTPYQGMELQGFNYEEGPLTRILGTHFLELIFKSVHNCITGRST